MLTTFLIWIILVLLVLIVILTKQLEDTENALLCECEYVEKLEKEILNLKTK